MNNHTSGPARHARMIGLSPAQAARTLLDGEFITSDQPALCFALRKDPRITLDDNALLDVFVEVLDEFESDRFPGDRVTADAFLDRLAAATPPGTAPASGP